MLEIDFYLLMLCFDEMQNNVNDTQFGLCIFPFPVCPTIIHYVKEIMIIIS